MVDQAETQDTSQKAAPFDTHIISLKIKKTKTALLMILLITLASIPPTPTATGTIPGANGKIAFCSKGTHNNWQIYVMNADGSERTRLTNNEANDYYPAWSPDGTKIAFTSDRDGHNQLYIMNADGSGQTRLTNSDAWDETPTWNPDGTKIAFSSWRDGLWEVYVMNPDGTGQTRLTNYIRRTGSPNWSPDGARIVFNSDADGDQEIYIMNFDGSSQQRLTGNNHDDLQPVWSPDGAKIVFRSNRDGNWEIYTMNSDGTEQTRLTNNPGWDESPAWSPDGKKIIFPSDINSIGRQQIYVMNTDGSNLQRLTNNEEVDQAVSWQSLGPNPSQPWGPMEVSTHNGGQISLGPISVISSSPDYDISGGIIYTRYNFIGDFDVQVDYRAGEGWYDEQASNRGNPHLEAACLGVLADGSSLKMIHLVPPDGSDQLFMWNEPQGQTPSNPATTEAPNQSSGKMRITRNGLELEFLYISSGTWQSLYTTQEFPRTLSIFVSATTVYTNHTFSTIFENFKVNSNETTSKCLVTLEAGPGGSITPSGIHQYNINSTLTITATPDEGCQFLRWETETSIVHDPYSSSTTLQVMGGTVKAIFTDASPPTLSLETPANGGLFWGEDVLISGVFYDRTGINAESVKLVVDGTKVTSGIYMGEGLILYYTNYSIGTHVAQLTVEDVSGNTATASTSFTVIPIGSIAIPIIVAMYMILILYLAIAKK